MSSMKFKGLLAGASVAATLAFAGGAANAATINISAGNQPDLSGKIEINLGDQTGIAGGNFLFDVTLTNNDDATWTNSRITSFYLISNPTSTYASDTSSYTFVGNNVSQSSSSNTSTFDFCFEADTNGNCTGGNPNVGLGEDDSETFQLVVSATSEPVFFGGALRWQALDGGASAYGECTADCGDDGDVDLPPIPLPAGLPLILTGLGVFGALRLRKRKTA